MSYGFNRWCGPGWWRYDFNRIKVHYWWLLSSAVSSCQQPWPAFKDFSSSQINPYNVNKWYNLKKGDRWLQSAKIGGGHFNDQQLDKAAYGKSFSLWRSALPVKNSLLRKMSGSVCILSCQTAHIPPLLVCKTQKSGRKVGRHFLSHFQPLCLASRRRFSLWVTLVNKWL